MSAGRKPSTQRLHQLRNGHRLGERTGTGVVPEKPAWLDLDAAMEWDRLVPDIASTGIVNETDATMLASYCMQYSIWRQAQRRVATEGIIVTDRFGADKANPALKVYQDAAAEMRRLADEFGFTPSARSSIKVGATEAGEEQDAFSEWQDGAAPRLADAN